MNICLDDIKRKFTKVFYTCCEKQTLNIMLRCYKLKCLISKTFEDNKMCVWKNIKVF